MKKRLTCRILAAITLCIAIMSIAACAVGPGIDGGIVGTGNRRDCESQTTMPDECKRPSSAPR